MTTRSEDDASLAGPGGAAGKPLSLALKRTLIAVVGAALAFGGGAGMAYAFRISPDITAAADPADMTVQDELPSIAATRAYALNNPPSYAPAVNAQPVAETVSLPEPITDRADARETPAPDDADNTPPSRPQPYRTAFNDADAPPVAATLRADAESSRD